jgi:hypothetical protein
LATESALLGGASAIEQKLTTGEVNWEDVAIQAGIPVALRSVRAIRAAVRRGDPKIIKAVGEVVAKQAPQGEIVPPVKPQEQINVYKTTSGSRTGITEPEVVRQGERYVDSVTGEDVILDQAASGSALIGGKPGVRPATAGQQAGKQPWEMTKEEFGNTYWIRGTMKAPSGVASKLSGGLSEAAYNVIGDAWHRSEPRKFSQGETGQIHLYKPEQLEELPVGVWRGAWRKVKQGEKPLYTMNRKEFGSFENEIDPYTFIVQQARSEGKFIPPEVLAEITPPAPAPAAGQQAGKQVIQAYVKDEQGNIYTANTHGEAYMKMEDAGGTQKIIRDSGFVVDGKLIRDSEINRGELEKQGFVSQPPAPAPAVAPAPAPATPVAPGNTQTVIDKLVPELKKSLKTQKKLRKGIELAYSKERGRRAEAQTKYLYELLAGKMGETEAQAKSESKFAGELIGEEDRISQEAIPQLSDAEWDVLQRKVIDTYPDAFRAYSRLRASEAINKIRRGEVLQNNEIEAVSKILGLKISKLLRKQQPFSDRLLRNLFDVTGLTKVIGSSGDISYAFKQIWTGFYRSPTTWARSVGKGVKAFFSQEQFDRSQQEIKDSKYYEEALEHRLQLTDMGEFESRSTTEESFPGRLAAKWPLAKQGNRAAVVKANQIRMGLYEKIRNLWERQGVPITDARLNKLAGMINDFSGRSNIPRGPRVQALFNFLNVIGYSPRFALSRVKNTVTLFHTLSTDPYIAKEGLKTLAGYIATTTTIALLADMLGYKIELNPYSADWMKPKKGHTRLDFQGGHGQVIRFIIQMAHNKQKTEAGEIKDIPRKDVLMKFIRSKRAPIVGLISDIWTGRDFSGQPIEGIGGWTKEIVEQFLYLWLRDAVEAFSDAHESEDLLTSLGYGAKAAVTSWVGIGVQTYPPTAGTETQIGKNSYAQVEYGKNWDELNPLQQRKLTREHKQEFEEAEQQIKVEGAKERDYEFLSRMAEQEREAGDAAIKGLSSGAKDELGRLGVTILLSRVINDYKLNDKRYNEYQQTVARQLKEPLEQLLSSPLWNHYSDKRKVEKIQRKIMLAKRAAQRETIRGVNTNE